MHRLTNPDSVLSETRALRDRRDSLLREAKLYWFRPHVVRQLQKELKQVTNDLLKMELVAREKPEPRSEPMGDAGACGGQIQRRLPYKD